MPTHSCKSWFPALRALKECEALVPDVGLLPDSFVYLHIYLLVCNPEWP